MMNESLSLHELGLAKKPGCELGYIFIGCCTNARLSDFATGCAIYIKEEDCSNLTSNRSTRFSSVKRAAERNLGLDKVFPRCWL